jgi:hypothetical protein
MACVCDTFWVGVAVEVTEVVEVATLRVVVVMMVVAGVRVVVVAMVT